jgi:ATP-dependent exoDNAse (exonuclease V) beta subunit
MRSVMTIHKSKGLEFPVVIFPFAEEDYTKTKDKLWLNAEEQDFGLPKVLIDNSTAVEVLEKKLLLFQSKKQEELLDNINVLYVALTRAEEQLYVISNMNLSSKGISKNNMCSFSLIIWVTGDFSEEKLEYNLKCNEISSVIQHVDTSKIIPVVAEILNQRI